MLLQIEVGYSSRMMMWHGLLTSVGFECVMFVSGDHIRGRSLDHSLCRSLVLVLVLGHDRGDGVDGFVLDVSAEATHHEALLSLYQPSVGTVRVSGSLRFH